MMMLELKTTSTRFKDSKTVEFYERKGNTRTIYRFEFPVQKSIDKTCQVITVGLKDNYYKEHPHRLMTEDDLLLFQRLEKSAQETQIRQTTSQQNGLVNVETIYFEPNNMSQEDAAV